MIVQLDGEKNASRHSGSIEIYICELDMDPSPFERYTWIVSSCKGIIIQELLTELNVKVII